jgi:hypothetical protein
MVQAAAIIQSVNTQSYPRVLSSELGDALVLRGWRYPTLFLSAAQARFWAEKRFMSQPVEIHGPMANALIAAMAEAGAKFSVVRCLADDPVLQHTHLWLFELPNGLRSVVVDDDFMVLVHHQRFNSLRADFIVGPSFIHTGDMKPEARALAADIIHADPTPTSGTRRLSKPDLSERNLIDLYLKSLKA